MTPPVLRKAHWPSVVATTLVLGVLGGGVLLGTLIFSGAATTTLRSTQNRVAILINQARARHHEPPLKVDLVLASLAAIHTKDMITSGYFAHDAPLGQTFGERIAYLRRSRVGETIAWGTAGFGTASGIVSLWLNSPEHRAILLTRSFTRVGISVQAGRFQGQAGARVVTADFSTNPSASVPVPNPNPNPTPNPPPVTTPPVPVPPPASPPPVTPPPLPPPAVGSVVAAPYVCRGPVNGVRVEGVASSPIALVILGPGCTGTISFDVTIGPGGGDGVKVDAGAHDLVVGPSRVVCQKGENPNFHMDGVQVQGGTNVTFNGLQVVCPFIAGQGAAAFYWDGKDFPGISNVVCDSCDLEHSHYGAMWTAPAPGSGVRNSILHQGTVTGKWYAKLGNAADAIDQNNTLAPPCDGVAVPC